MSPDRIFLSLRRRITVNKKGDTAKNRIHQQGARTIGSLISLTLKTAWFPMARATEVQFIADKAGTFEYYCFVGNHRQMGMVGTLTVK